MQMERLFDAAALMRSHPDYTMLGESAGKIIELLRNGDLELDAGRK